MKSHTTCFLFAAASTFAIGCAQETHKVEAAPSEALSGEAAIVGTYDVAATSSDTNCVYDDAVWTIDRTADRQTYLVDTAATYAYIHDTDATYANGVMGWTEYRDYTYQGCNYSVSFAYRVSLDASGNIQGSITLRSAGACMRPIACDFVVSSQRTANNQK